MSEPSGERPVPVARAYAPSALPSTTARLLAFLAIVVGGICGAVIGWSVVDLQCGTPDRPGAEQPADDGGCDTLQGIGAVGGAVVGAGGVAVVAVLVLRAMAEWRRDMDLEGEPAPPPDEPPA
jgi:hypothetical protein